jgi:hypothetical protein
LLLYEDDSCHCFGFKNRNGEIAIHAQYHYAPDTLRTIATVIDTTWRLHMIDRRGKEIQGLIPFCYADFLPDNEVPAEGLFRFVENEKMGFADLKGRKVIPAKFDFVFPFDNGAAEYHIGGHREYAPNGEIWTWTGSDETGYINKKGKIIKDNKFVDKLIEIVSNWLETRIEEVYGINENIDYFEPPVRDFCCRSQPGKVIISDAIMNTDKNTIDFELYKNKNDYGFFLFDVWLNAIDTGVVYLKAFEVNTKKPLSVESLKRESSMQVHHQTNDFVKYGSTCFVISEFGTRYYLASFELWYIPENKGEERKLATKIYKIQGFVD